VYRYSPTGRRPQADPELTAGITYPLWPMTNPRDPPGGAGECSWGDGCRVSLLDLVHPCPELG